MNAEPIRQDEDLSARARIDATVERTLVKARKGKLPVHSTPESSLQGEEIMARARTDAVAERIQRGDYIRLDQLQVAWHVKRATIITAVAAGRLFVVIGPSGESYYPAFYSDPSLDRRVLERVFKALGRCRP